MQHKKVTDKYIEITLECPRSKMSEYIEAFMEGSPPLHKDKSIARDLLSDSYIALSDYEGHYDGIRIYNTQESKPLIKFICKKIGIKYKDAKGFDFQLVP